MLKLIAIITLIAAGIAAMACSDDEDGNGAVSETPQAVTTEATSDRDDLIEDAEAEINNLREELEQLQQDIEGSDAGEEIEQQAGALEERINEAEEELQNIRDAGDDDWQEFREELDEAINEAEGHVSDLRDDLGLN